MPEVVLAVADTLAVPFDGPAEVDTVVEWDVEGLEEGVVVVDVGAVGVPDVSCIGPPVRVVLLALSFFHRVRFRYLKSLWTCLIMKW